MEGGGTPQQLGDNEVSSNNYDVKRSFNIGKSLNFLEISSNIIFPIITFLLPYQGEVHHCSCHRTQVICHLHPFGGVGQQQCKEAPPPAEIVTKLMVRFAHKTIFVPNPAPMGIFDWPDLYWLSGQLKWWVELFVPFVLKVNNRCRCKNSGSLTPFIK